MALGTHHATPRKAFTIIELLIVVGIIALLVSVSLMVGHRVVEGGKDRVTQDIIRVLDSSVLAYEAAKSQMPPNKYVIRDKDGKVQYDFPIVDARLDSAQADRLKDLPIQSVARYTAMLAEVPSAQAVIASISPIKVREVDVAVDTATGASFDVVVDGKKRPIKGQEILDGWGNPIRAVCPGYDGGYGKYFDKSSIKSRNSLNVDYWVAGSKQSVLCRRSYRPFSPASAAGQNIGDADEGLCPSGRMYFYSAGGDRDPGKRDDNVYANVPQFAAETATFD